MISRRSILSLVTASLVAPRGHACVPVVRGANLEREVMLAYQQAAAVVLAEVIEATAEKAFPPFGEGATYHARLKVMVTWKGRYEPGSEFDTIAGNGAAMCNAVLEAGEVHLLYLEGSEPYDLTAIRHLPLKNASQDIQLLGDRYRRPAAG
jgi:hypothetical protein